MPGIQTIKEDINLLTPDELELVLKKKLLKLDRISDHIPNQSE